TYYYFADYFVGGDPTTTTHGADLAIPVPAGADFMEVQLVVPFEVFDFNYNDPDPWSVSYSANQRWSLTVYDWTDRDGDGVLWEDFSADGVVNPQQTTVSTLIYQEAFEGAFPPAGWTLHNNGGCGDWESTATTGRTNYTGGSGDAADADSDWCGSGMDTELWTPSIDLSDAIDPVLSFNTYFNSWYNDDHGYVDISIDGGTVWTNLLDYNDDVGPNWTEQIDLSAYAGEADVMLRFHYTAPGWDWYWEVDDVTISSQSVNDELDISYTGPTTMTEINRFTYGYNYANVQEAVVRLGDRTDIDNIVIGIVHRNPNNTRPGWGADEYQANPLLVKVVFYEKAGWDLVMESPTSLNVPAGGSATFEATFAVPADQAPGLYEGAITVDDGTHVSIIPTTVNVAVPGDDLLFTLGGEDDSMTPYDNANMERGYTWSGVLEEGDWRFFFYDADAGFDQQYLYVQNQWGELCSNMPTWNETLVWGPNPGDQYSLLEPDKYGPYGLQFAGGTPRANDWTMAPRNGFWWQNGDGTPLPESRAWATLWDGLNQVQFRNVLLSGQFDCGEGYEATAGVFGVDAPETGLQINTDRLSGSFVVDAVSPVDGLQVYAYGFGDEERFQNQDVPQGKHFEEWPDDLFSGWVYEFEASNNNAIEIETFGPWSSDIDLYLMYDANGDGLYNMYDNREAVASSYTWGSEEHIWFNGSQGIPFVADGTYAVIMYGYWVEPGDQFDLRLNTYGGEGLAFEGVQGGYASLDTVPGEPESLVVNYEVPDNGIFNGYLVFGMPWEEEPENWWMGPGIFVPVTINANGVEFTYSSKVVDQEVGLQSSGTGNDVTLTYTITLVNDGVEDMFVRMVDLIPEGTTIYEQWVQDPDDPAGDGWWYTMKVSFDNGSTWYEWYTEDCWDNYNNGEYLCWTGNVGPSTSGKVYIEYTVKVLPHFAGEIMNKADVWMDWGDYHDFFSLKAFTDVLYAVYLPIVDFK
ncbi:MAG: hypothetical protein KJ638_15165, partial [Chloroflexi bacterium]|nr:hypothetical protein [Chloroflexota bacterium]